MSFPLTTRAWGLGSLDARCSFQAKIRPFLAISPLPSRTQRPIAHICAAHSGSGNLSGYITRRGQLAVLTALAGLSLVSQSPPALAASSDVGGPATTAAEAIRRDFVDRQYYVTGELSRDLFAPDCLFKDPTVEVTGVDPYVKALQTLFDPATSRADLISLEVTGPNTLALRWRLEGSLKLGGLRIKPYTGTTLYTISDGGKVVRHEETWDISTLDAFVSTFFPKFGAPPAPPVTLLPPA